MAMDSSRSVVGLGLWVFEYLMRFSEAPCGRLRVEQAFMPCENWLEAGVIFTAEVLFWVLNGLPSNLTGGRLHIAG